MSLGLLDDRSAERVIPAWLGRAHLLDTQDPGLLPLRNDAMRIVRHSDRPSGVRGRVSPRTDDPTALLVTYYRASPRQILRYALAREQLAGCQDRVTVVQERHRLSVGRGAGPVRNEDRQRSCGTPRSTAVTTGRSRPNRKRRLTWALV